MTFSFDTSEIPPSDRAELIRETIWNSVVRVEIEHHPDPKKLAAQGMISDIGRMNVCSARSNATSLQRTPGLLRDDMEPSIFLGLQVSGTSIVIQGDREAVLQPGDFALFDAAAPYTLAYGDGIDGHYFRFPRNELALPSKIISRMTALQLGSGNPVAELAATYFRRLADSHDMSALPNGDLVGHPSIELIRAVIATHLDEPDLAKEPLEATLQYRIMQYVRAHLAEHDLTAARIAAKHAISVRQLYAILSRSGITLSEWVRAHRLEECRKDLARPGARATTIASIAHRWGFADATHFSRVFKEAYGMSPRDWRAIKQGNSST